jgi:tetratricopeptide (TPR) repeat protein
LQRWQAVKTDAEKALQLNPSFAEAYKAHHALAWALYHVGDTDQAFTSIARALDLNPRYGPAYAARATFWLRKAEHDRVIADCSQAIKLIPQDPYAYSIRAQAYFAKGDQASAFADLDKVKTLGNRGHPGQ